MSEFVLAELISPVIIKNLPSVSIESIPEVEIKTMPMPGSSLKSNFHKGFMTDMLLTSIEATISYQPSEPMELKGLDVALTGYSAGDYWELYIHDLNELGEVISTKTVCETIYTKEIAESKDLMPVEKLNELNKLEFKFFNISGTTKTIWVDMRFLK